MTVAVWLVPPSSVHVTVIRLPGWWLWMRVVSRPLGSHDATHAKAEMAATLTNLAAALEE